MAYTITMAVLALLAQAAGPAEKAAVDLKSPDAARRLLQNGRYAEAEEAYQAAESEAKKQQGGLTPQLEAALAMGTAECQASQGEYGKAIEVLKSLAGRQPKNADVTARLAELHFTRGDWDSADTAVKQTLDASADHLLGRWIAVRLLESRGKLEDAVKGCKWFVDHYNTRPPDLARNAQNLLLVGQAAERYYRATARGEELSDSLNDVINEIYEAALRADPNCWQAPWLEGKLFLAGYNERSAVKELARAQQINPLAAEILVTLGQADLQGYRLAAGRSKAERALAVNPHYGPAQVLLCDLNISDERFTDARNAAEQAVAENPRDEDALARLAASCRLLVDPAGAAAAELMALALSPRPATFYAAVGERLADRRKYLAAERAFLQSAQADPTRADAPIGLGMLYMQIGRETEARSLFDEAFAADPFNVRADNMMKVLKHLASYTPVETEQFSVRTIGLPFIPTVGACTGKVVALASPRSTRQAFNWARVLKHEVVHVITLQQTEFNIPHWYTEALAVDSEGYPRPQEWNKILLERVPSRSKLLNLDTINLGFIRPNEPDDRQMAYCQAQLYARYMLKRFGGDALIKMLMAYRRGLTTDRAIQECFQVEKADFEKAYLAYLDEVVKTIRTRVNEEKPVKFSQLERQLKENPEDADLNARMAYEHFARRDYKEARPLAEKALELKPHHPLASYVKARLLTTIGDDDAALALLEPALNPKRPDERVVDLLAELKMKAGQLDEAEKLYELARKDDPYHTKWIAGLARVHLRQKSTAKFLGDLAMIAANDADDIAVRKALAERNLAGGNTGEAEKWAEECLHIDVYDPAAHVLLADAQSARGKFAPAVEEYKTALELKARRPNDLKVKLAKAQLGLGQRDAAKATLGEILKTDPDHPEAKALRKQIDHPGSG